MYFFSPKRGFHFLRENPKVRPTQKNAESLLDDGGSGEVFDDLVFVGWVGVHDFDDEFVVDVGLFGGGVVVVGVFLSEFGE